MQDDIYDTKRLPYLPHIFNVKMRLYTTLTEPTEFDENFAAIAFFTEMARKSEGRLVDILFDPPMCFQSLLNNILHYNIFQMFYFPFRLKYSSYIVQYLIS